MSKGRQKELKNEKEFESKWVTCSLDSRSIGAVAVAEENSGFYPERISRMYNAIIYIDSTHASHCFAVY